jgi:hypothetical protein
MSSKEESKDETIARAIKLFRKHHNLSQDDNMGDNKGDNMVDNMVDMGGNVMEDDDISSNVKEIKNCDKEMKEIKIEDAYRLAKTQHDGLTFHLFQVLHPCAATLLIWIQFNWFIVIHQMKKW